MWELEKCKFVNTSFDNCLYSGLFMSCHKSFLVKNVLLFNQGEMAGSGIICTASWSQLKKGPSMCAVGLIFKLMN